MALGRSVGAPISTPPAIGMYILFKLPKYLHYVLCKVGGYI